MKTVHDTYGNPIDLAGPPVDVKVIRLLVELGERIALEHPDPPGDDPDNDYLNAILDRHMQRLDTDFRERLEQDRRESGLARLSHRQESEHAVLGGFTIDELKLADFVQWAAELGVEVDLWEQEEPRLFEYRVSWKPKAWSGRSGSKHKVFAEYVEMLDFLDELKAKQPLSSLRVQQRRVGQWLDTTELEDGITSAAAASQAEQQRQPSQSQAFADALDAARAIEDVRERAEAVRAVGNALMASLDPPTR